MRCDFAYGAFLISSIGFLASSIWLRTTYEVALEKGGNNIFSLPAYLALLLVFPVLGVGAGAVAFPHAPVLALGCVCLHYCVYLMGAQPAGDDPLYRVCCPGDFALVVHPWEAAI